MGFNFYNRKLFNSRIFIKYIGLQILIGLI